VVARNVAILAVTDARPPALGPTEGVEVEAGRPWRWTRTVSPTGDARVVRVDVAVADASGQQLAKLTLIRPPTREPRP
jgi:general secretion pathway protein I